jgi:hypothetical protein
MFIILRWKSVHIFYQSSILKFNIFVQQFPGYTEKYLLIFDKRTVLILHHCVLTYQEMSFYYLPAQPKMISCHEYLLRGNWIFEQEVTGATGRAGDNIYRLELFNEDL